MDPLRTRQPHHFSVRLDAVVSSEARRTHPGDDDQASRAARRGAVVLRGGSDREPFAWPMRSWFVRSGSELGVGIGAWRATARPSSDIAGTTRVLGVPTRTDARRRCSAARGRRSRGSSCAVPGRRRGGARRLPWRACSRRAAARWRRTRASSAGRSGIARGTRRYLPVLAQVWRVFPCRHTTVARV